MSERVSKYPEGIGLASETVGAPLRQAALGYLEFIYGHDVARIIGEYPSSAIVFPNLWVKDLVVFGTILDNSLLVKERKRHMQIRYQLKERKGEYYTLRIRKKEPKVIIRNDGVGLEVFHREGWAFMRSPSNGVDIFKATEDGVNEPERLELGLIPSPEFTGVTQLKKFEDPAANYAVGGASLIQAGTIYEFDKIVRQHANPITENSSAILFSNFLVAKSIKNQPLTSTARSYTFSAV